jgi:hypothetical protein
LNDECNTKQNRYGSILSRGDGASPQNFTRIAEVRKVGEFGSERGLIDMTNLDSPDTFMEYLLAMKDGVELPVECNFLPANATQSPDTGLIKDHNDGVARDFTLELPGSFGTFSFTALVRAWKANVAPNEGLIATFTLKLTGAIDYTP